VNTATNPKRSSCLPAVAAAISILALAAPARAAEPAAPAPAPRVEASDADAAAAKQREIRGGRIVRNSGIGGLSLGVLMIGVGAGLEHKRRTDVCKETLSDEHGDACDRSKMANITVLAMGVTFTVAGAVLLGLGQAKINRAKRNSLARISLAPQLARGFAGATITGRF
jgi:hypothetical protein